MAGLSRNTSTRSSGGIAAIRAGSRCAPLLQHQRSRERLLHGHLLVQREADQQGVRVLRKQPVGLIVLRPGKQGGAGACGRHA